MRYLSRVLFTADLSKSEGASTQPSYGLRSAREAGFKEEWLQNAVATNPELVIAPCREAGLTEEGERWSYWAREVSVAVGSIDVLLVSEFGRVAIVETKLSYNPEARRSVLAQLLEYAVSLPEGDFDALPPLPTDAPAFREAVQERIERGDFLLIVAGDLLDARAVKLSRSVLGAHLLNSWELALVEVAVFEHTGGADGAPRHLLVPHLRGVIEPESRQVVRVVVERGDQNRVVVQRQAPETPASAREKWTEERFYTALATAALSQAYRNFGQALTDLRAEFPGVELTFGTGKTGSATLKRNGQSLGSFYLSGALSFYKNSPALAVGEATGRRYVDGLQRLFPDEMARMSDPTIPAARAEPRLAELVALLRGALSSAV